MPPDTQLHSTTLHASLFHGLFVSPISQSVSVQELEPEEATLPNFGEFLKGVQNGELNVLRGVYIPNVLAFAVVQQPVDQAGYVSSKAGEITQFRMPTQFGNVGLLAHNDLCGRYFFQFAIGQEARLVYGDGSVEYFVITQVLRYQAFQPDSPYSDFRDLSSGEILTAEQVFRKAYTGERHVTFQTCIAADGISGWGRIFVIAKPASLDFRPWSYLPILFSTEPALSVAERTVMGNG
jgi:hypothetical protein